MNNITFGEPSAISISANEYHADPAPAPSLSSSIARILLRQSPAHAWHAHPRLNPNFKREESSRMDLGSIAHALLLEPDEAKLAIVEADDWRTKAAKEQRDEARANGLLPILAWQERNVRAMIVKAREFVSASEVGGFMTDGKPEQTLIWQDEGGIWCRSRLDWLSNDHILIVDLKTCENAEPDNFGRLIAANGYDIQAAFYCRAVERVFDLVMPPHFVFLAQEITPPFECSLVGLSSAMRELAAESVSVAVKRWGECLASNQWSGYPRRICYAEPPGWMLAQHAQMMEESV